MYVQPRKLLSAIKCFSDPQKRIDYFRLYSDDIILLGYQGIEPGLESVKQFYYVFWKLFPDAQVLIQDLVGERDTLVARYTITRTMREAFMGVPAKGQQIELPGISILHFRHGPMFRALDMLKQFGAIASDRGVLPWCPLAGTSQMLIL
jgi:predicted ester cyclase